MAELLVASLFPLTFKIIDINFFLTYSLLTFSHIPCVLLNPIAFQRTLEQEGDGPKLPNNDNSSVFVKLKRRSEVEKELEAAGLVLEDVDMEICDPCYCYTKCWLDTVASLFCVSLL